MRSSKNIENAALGRIHSCEDQIRNSVRMVSRGTPLTAETNPKRLRQRIRAKTLLDPQQVERLATTIESGQAPTATEARGAGAAGGAERLYGDTIDFVGVEFFDRGARAARSVARVTYSDGQPLGTGFMISDTLFITNNHVIGTPEEAAQLIVEFDYQRDPDSRPRETTRFALDPATFFVTDERDDLDFTVIAVGRRLSGSRAIDDLGCCVLSPATDKHALGEFANIVQHPDGRYKEVVLRENRLVSRLETVLHYLADTEPGASGSPVFNNEWQVIALHHWGGPWRQQVDDQGKRIPAEVNEGIRASAIVRSLQERRNGLDAQRSGLLDAALQGGERGGRADSVDVPGRSGHTAVPMTTGGVRVDADGRATWSIPIEISVRIPGLVSTEPQMAAIGAPLARVAPLGDEKKRTIDPDYSSRHGYKPGIIPGQVIQMPKLSAAMKKLAAKNREAEPGDDPYELKYHHFSIVMNAERKLAFFTACNIDGKTAKDIDRDSGVVKPRTGPDPERALAEATERWAQDPRLGADEMTSDPFYAKQEVPGVTNKQTRAFSNQMFQRGHLVRRVDPAWGTNAQALAAEADTFHHTNCSPQVGFFNMGTYADVPGTGNGKLWRALEDYVLDSAAEEDLQVCVFTGPVFEDDDPSWRNDQIDDFKIPKRFWKVVVWEVEGDLRARAMLADQSAVIKVMSEAKPGQEGFANTAPVRDFLSSVAEIERLTGLEFGENVRTADLSQRDGEESLDGKEGRFVKEVGEISLTPKQEQRA